MYIYIYIHIYTHIHIYTLHNLQPTVTYHCHRLQRPPAVPILEYTIITPGLHNKIPAYNIFAVEIMIVYNL